MCDKQAHEANWRTAMMANNDVALYAGELSRHFLAGTFMSLFHVERACELSNPEVFDIDMSPDRLETRRMSAVHWLHFSSFLLNEELLARRAVSEQEYEFVLLLDVSRSVTRGWFDALTNATWQHHPCYRLKYVAYALLMSAFEEGFKCRVLFLDQDGTFEWVAKDDETFAFAILERIDEHIRDRPRDIEPLWPWEATLQDLAESPNQLLVALVSDFLDPVHEHIERDVFVSLIVQLHLAKRLAVLQINHLRDVTLSLGGEGDSEYDLHYGEDGERRALGVEALQAHRIYLRDWLGELEEDNGEFASRLAESRIPHQRFLHGDDINQRFEELAHLIAQE